MMDADILKAPTEDGIKAAREAIRIQGEISRLEAELTMASSIQSDMLPNIFPAFPDRDEFDIYTDPRIDAAGKRHAE